MKATNSSTYTLENARVRAVNMGRSRHPGNGQQMKVIRAQVFGTLHAYVWMDV